MAELNTNGSVGAVTADMAEIKSKVASNGVEVIQGDALPSDSINDGADVASTDEEIAGDKPTAAEGEGQGDETPDATPDEDGHIPFAESSFAEAEEGTSFKDADGKVYEKLEGVTVPVPRCDPASEMYKNLKEYAFDQDDINREFWKGKGDVSEDTIKALKEVFPGGMVDEFFASKKAEHLTFWDALSRRDVDAERTAAEIAEKQVKRDTDTLSLVATTFGAEDGAAKWPEVVDFINANYEQDRRKEIAVALSTGTMFSRKALLNVIKRDMEYSSGDVHKLINADGVVSAAKVGGGALSGEQFHTILSNPTNPDHKRYHSEPAFAAEVDARRQKGIELGM